MTSSYGNSMLNILRNCQAVFHSGGTILCSYQQCMRVPIYPRSHQHMLLHVFLVTATLVKWCLTVVLLCISIITKDVWHLCMCSLDIPISPLVKRLFKSFAHLKIIFNLWFLFIFIVGKEHNIKFTSIIFNCTVQ